jgi:predicted lipoprotein with Yx(FWY)xxD motif
MGTTVLAVALLVTVLAAGQIAHGQTRSVATVSLRKTNLGIVLVVGTSQHTLYLFAKDHNGKSSCSGSCAQFWPPLVTQHMPTAGKGVKASKLGTTKRANGALQVTYYHHPLYTYALDKKAGQTKGEGLSAFGAKWYALNGSGNAVIKTTSTTTTTTTYPYNTTTTNPYSP